MTQDRIYGASISPRSFADGLNLWRSDLFDVSSAKWDKKTNVEFLSESFDSFGSIKLVPDSNNIEIVHHNKIPILVGQYLEASARIRLQSGPAVIAQIIAIPVTNRGEIIAGSACEGPEFTINADGAVNVTAIFGSGNRPGVDMAWGLNFDNCYIGVRIKSNGESSVIIDRIDVNDATGYFLSTNSDWVDIRDYGAVGNGEFNCRDAIVAADNDANGRAIFIPKGDYFIDSDLSILSPIRAYGKLVCSENTAVMLADTFDLHAYINVFKDSLLALKKALQALFRFTNHSQLDLNGRIIKLTEPLDVQALVGVTSKSTTPKMVHNGELVAKSSTAWNTTVISAKASWSKSNPTVLTNVSNIDSIALGSLVEGNGVGREIYVIKKDPGNQTIEVSSPISNAAETQSYDFIRYKFLIDCSGFQNLGRFEISHVTFSCNNKASGWMLAQFGRECRLADSSIRYPKDRGVCSFDQGCGGFQLDRCLLDSPEYKMSAKDRVTIGLSTRKNDIKVRDCTATYFKNFVFLDGSGHIITGNHLYQGSPGTGTPQRSAGIVITYKRSKALIVGNYIDNCWVEITDEQSIYVKDERDASFGMITMTGNIFIVHTTTDDFRWIKLRPNSNNCYIDGFVVTSNTFCALGDCVIERVESVIENNGKLDLSNCHKLRFENNSFQNVRKHTISPITRTISRNSNTSTWRADFSDAMPFGASVSRVESVTALKNLTTTSLPKIALGQGSGGQSADLIFSTACRGSVSLKVGADVTD